MVVVFTLPLSKILKKISPSTLFPLYLSFSYKWKYERLLCSMKMAGLIFYSIAVSCSIVLLIWAWRAFNWMWLRPKKLEKKLRRQGFRGNSYRLLFGDLKEMSMMTKEAKSKPINLSNDIVQRVMPFIHGSIKQYGKNSFMWLGPKPMVFVMDPDSVKDILSKNYQFQKPKENLLIRWLIPGLLDYETEKWAQHRKIINPAFHLGKLKHMLPAIHLSCDEMMSKWEKMVSREGSCELDVWPNLLTLSGDVISRTAFGSNYEEGRKIFELQKELADLIIDFAQTLYFPVLRFLPTKRNKRMRKIYNETQSSLRAIVSERMEAMKAGETSDDNLLGILLESNFKEIENGSKYTGMSIKEVIEECRVFYFAGQETTSVLLVWTMILLSKHQSWQTRARDEVMQVFGNNKPDFDGLNHLKIVTMILYEVLRLYPPVIGMTRTFHQDTKVGETMLPTGVQLFLPILQLHHDNDIWGDDAKEFKPERFSEGVSKATRGHVSFFPFSWGPRICIGQNFAMLEAKMVLTMILQRFSFELSPSYAHTPYTVITLQPQHGAHLILKKI